MVSVIVPVYNVKDYLEKCIDSLKKQTLEDIEIIVVDDGSTDGSGELVDRLCKDLQNFRVFHKENGGLMSAWTFGVRQSKGDYIGFVDSDDYVAENMFSEMQEKALKYKTDIVLCNHYYVNQGASKELDLHRNPIDEGFYENENLEKIKHKIFPKKNQDYVSPARVNKLIKKDFLLQNLKYCDTRITSAEDVNIMVPCLLGAQRFYYIDKPLYFYVHRKSSISNVFKEEILSTYTILVNKLKQAMNDYKYQDADKIEIQLWNFYGALWCSYVFKSNLKLKDKNAQINRLSDVVEYKKACKFFGNGFSGKIYKFSVKHKCGWLYVLMKKFQIMLKRDV